jgi:two-component system, cell cycle response regulator DivK
VPTKILLIEDNEQSRYLATFLLEKRGYEVVTACKGHAGKERPALIPLDIQLPRVDGYAVARALRESLSLASTAIVASSSYATLGGREKALAAGCDGYLGKPINPNTFVSQQVKCYLRPRAMEESL